MTMIRLFGSTKKTPKATLSDAISSVQTESRADAVQVKIRKLDAELTRYRDQMKKMREGPAKKSVQQRALRVLKYRKLYEAQYDNLQQQSLNMEHALMTTENLRNVLVTVAAMETTNKALKRQYKNIDLDKIEQLQDEMQDLMAQACEVQESLGRSYNLPDDIDESDLEAELDALGDELTLDELGIPSYLEDTGYDLPKVADNNLELTNGLKQDEFGLPIAAQTPMKA